MADQLLRRRHRRDHRIDPLTGKKVASLNSVRVYANSHYVTPGPTLKQAGEAIKHELSERLKELIAEGNCSKRSASNSAPTSISK